MSATNLLVSAAILGVVVWAAVGLLRESRQSGSSLPLPPGPKPKPLIGNLGDLPPPGAREWEHWAKHKELYGPISSVTAFGTTIVILSTLKAATELLDGRSAIYSDRAKMEFGGELCGWKYMLALRPYGNGMRAVRKFLHSGVGTKASLAQYADLQEVEVRRFLLRTLERPKELRDHIRTEAGAIILKVAYGYEIEPHKEDPLVKLVDNAMDQFSKAMIPGAWMVDMIPMLRHLPDWMPGTGFKQTAKLWKATLIDTVEKPKALVRKQMAEGRGKPSMLSQAFEKAPNMDAEQEDIVKWGSGALYAGGADTTVSTMATFFLLLSLNPDVQRKAREEIDRVVGADRLPTLADRESLPYICAVFSEALRFHPIAPMGLPHMTTTEDEYEGYRIPKGAIVMPAAWGYTRDTSVYPDPETFNPDRFLGPDAAPHPDFVFGFGRRVCPGKLLAEQSVWLTIANSLAVFDVTGPGRKTKGGESMFLGGMVSHPAPYDVTVTARSPAHAALIREVERSHPWAKSDAEELAGIKV
ncbi:cytochrome P450 [Apiospora kogelbergensis]|uniref:cytochrome P450 n=1 Tax=Apiospora kogelbergensis TaxID=1337665 RepID=UPI003130FE17